jgi:hypothetical protein
MMNRKILEANALVDKENEIIANRNKKANKGRRKPLKQYETPIHLKAWSYSNNSQDVDLIIGTPVMSLRNCKGAVNGESFKIIGYTKKTIKLISELTGIECRVKIKNFQRNMLVSYCITSHRAQGQTFTEPYTIHEWDRLSNRSKYVSLSRADKWGNCNIMKTAWITGENSTNELN